MVIGGGAANCLGAEEDTAAPWAAGEALLEGDGAAPAEGFGSGLSELLIWADDGAVAAGLAGALVGAAGAADEPQPVSSSNTKPISAPTRKRSVNLFGLPYTGRAARLSGKLYWANALPIL
jgi:hypothetical protein